MMSNQQDNPADDVQAFYDVAVIGYGPTGLVAASLLGQAGYRVVVVERWPTMYGLPRLTHIDGETARIVQACGDIDQAMRDSLALHTYHYVNAAGELLLELEWKGKQCGYTAHNSIYQPDIEDAIHDRVAALPNVELLRGWEAVFLKQTDDGVTVAIQRTNTAKDGAQAAKDGQWAEPAKSFGARYVIGADGANSFVRRSLGIERNDFGHKHRWLNLDSENLSDAAERFKLLTIFCDPARGHMYMPIGDNRTRFEVRLLDGESIEEWEDPATGWRWLREKYGVGPEDFKFLRNVVYTFQTRMAERWREGNVLLGGDAAHAMMPYMGQGACSGMRDGINLAWKLDLVLSGRASAALLDSYEAERRPAGHFTVEQAYTRYVTRTAAYLKAKDYQPLANDFAIELGYRYDSAAVITEPGSPQGHEDPRESFGRPGARAPHLWLTRGGERISTIDLFGDGFVLLAGPKGEAWARALDAAAHGFAGLSARSHVIGAKADPEERFAAAFGITPQGASLVRPDGFVAWRAKNAPDRAAEPELRRVLSRLLRREM